MVRSLSAKADGVALFGERHSGVAPQSPLRHRSMLYATLSVRATDIASQSYTACTVRRNCTPHVLLAVPRMIATLPLPLHNRHGAMVNTASRDGRTALMFAGQSATL